jgi:hypothetical protein
MSKHDQPEESFEADFGLLMPFVSVASKGGPHDDESYVCGWEMGALDMRLNIATAAGALPTEATIHRTNLAQAELITMKYGIVLTELDYMWGDETSLEARRAAEAEWARISFTHDIGAPL